MGLPDDSSHHILADSSRVFPNPLEVALRLGN